MSVFTERDDGPGQKEVAVVEQETHGFGARSPECELRCLWTLDNSHSFFESQFLHPS